MRNQYAELCNESDTITEQYRNFVEANNEAADKLIPLKKKSKWKKPSNGARVNQAREDVQNAFTNFQNDTTPESQEKYQEEKVKLRQVYDEIQEEELNDMIHQGETADVKS